MTFFNKLFFLIFYSLSVFPTNQQNFDNIILIINFNHPYYSNIEFLKELYSPIFDNIVFYGEKEDIDVHKVTTNQGYLLSPVIEDALIRFPHAKGYLFLQDDCVLHFWNLLFLNQEKIWYAVRFNDGLTPNNRFYSMLNQYGQIISGYQWDKWNYKCGWGAAKTAYSQLNSRELNIVKANIGTHNIPANMCEVFYIPARLKDNFLRLSTIFKDVFCEIAIPTMLCCLDPLENWEQLDMLGGAGVGIGNPGSPMLANYPMQVSWVHPVKFSYNENRERILKIFKNVAQAL